MCSNQGDDSALDSDPGDSGMNESLLKSHRTPLSAETLIEFCSLLNNERERDGPRTCISSWCPRVTQSPDRMQGSSSQLLPVPTKELDKTQRKGRQRVQSLKAEKKEALQSEGAGGKAHRPLGIREGVFCTQSSHFHDLKAL